MPEQPRLRRTSIAIIVLASVIAFFAVFAVWAKRQVLETNTWTETSTELLANKDVQGALNTFLVDALFKEVNVEHQIKKALPDNLGMAYVFLPHLDPSRESAFREILSRSTSMQVFEVERGMRIAPDNVYVIPRNCEMTISKGELIINERKAQRSVHLTVDIFLRSLAAELG